MSLWDVHKSPQHSLTTMHLTQCVSRSTYFFSVSMRHALIWEPHLTLVESTTLCHPTLLCPAPFTVTLTQLTKGPYLELAKLWEWKTTIETNSRPLIMGLAPSTLLPSVTNSLLMNVGRPRTIKWVQIFFDDTKNGILFSFTNCKVLQSTNTPTDRALSKQASKSGSSLDDPWFWSCPGHAQHCHMIFISFHCAPGPLKAKLLKFGAIYWSLFRSG